MAVAIAVVVVAVVGSQARANVYTAHGTGDRLQQRGVEGGAGHMRTKNHNNQPRQPNRQATPQHGLTGSNNSNNNIYKNNNNLGTRPHKTPTLDAENRRRTRLYNKPHIAETTDSGDGSGQ